tara:strand:- start:152 stop:652 length:501 start_codon:yes stop_codon:yes gene_type:complete
MSQSQSWKPLNQRTSEIKDKVKILYEELVDKQLIRSELDLYEEMEWGQLNDGLLYRALIESQRKGACVSSEEIRKLSPPSQETSSRGVEDYEEEGINVVQPMAEQIGKPLKWFRANAPNSSIKNQAEDEFRIRLLNLYVAHVNKTGETYFPLLEEKLRVNAEFYDE